MDIELEDDQIERYARHLVLPEIGEEGQERLLASNVLVIGAGGLGSPLLLYLAAAGVGTIGVIDDDVVDFSNLQRQVAHDTSKVGIDKVESARARYWLTAPALLFVYAIAAVALLFWVLVPEFLLAEQILRLQALKPRFPEVALSVSERMMKVLERPQDLTQTSVAFLKVGAWTL